MDINTIEENIAHFIRKYGFIGVIEINLLYSDVIKDDNYIRVYYFVYQDEMYHIIVVYVDEVLHISLNNEIAKSKTETYK